MKLTLSHRVTILLLALAAFGFLAALGLHLLTFTPLNLEPLQPLYMLTFLGVFVVIVPLILLGRRQEKQNPSTLSQATRYTPRGFNVLVFLVLLYALFNFVSVMNANSGGSPTIQDGQYVLTSHGGVVRQLSAAEYTQAIAYEMRMWSGHPLVFYLGAVGLLYALQRQAGANQT